MSRWRSIWLVARREILERGRSRGFLFSVLFTTVLVAGLVHRARRSSSATTSRRRSGSSSRRRPGSSSALTATAGVSSIRTSTCARYRDAAAAEAALDAEEVDAVVDVPADLSGPGEVRFAEDDRPDHRPDRRGQRRPRLRMQDVLADAGVDPAASWPPSRQPPDGRDPRARDRGRPVAFLVANIGAVLILVGIFSFGFTVLTGVVEEKQSRVVEVVLSTVRPRDLLMGKVLGIGILGLVQLVDLRRRGRSPRHRSIGDVELPATTPGAIALLSIWFILGYTLYSTALGFLGALASRMEEASNASTPVTMVAMISYFVAIFAVVNDPSGPVATIATFLPPSAPFVVPLAGGVRCDRAARDRPVDPHHDRGDLGAVLDRGPGLRRRRPPDRPAG